MEGLDFGKVAAELPPYCLSLLQNPSDDMQRDLKAAVNLTRSQPVDDDVKLRLLGLQLLNLVGVEALEKAVVSLGDRIRKPSAAHVDRIMAQLDSAMAELGLAKVLVELPPYCLALLQNPSDDMQRNLKNAVDIIASWPADDNMKLRMLALQLLSSVGVEALEKAVASLGSGVRKPPENGAEPPKQK